MSNLNLIGVMMITIPACVYLAVFIAWNLFVVFRDDYKLLLLLLAIFGYIVLAVALMLNGLPN